MNIADGKPCFIPHTNEVHLKGDFVTRKTFARVFEGGLFRDEETEAKGQR